MAGTLSRAAVERACAFVEREGRALDAALLQHDLFDGPAQSVRTALAAYQNADGGFGHGLEPDLATPASTAIATSVGLRLLRRLDAGADDAMVAAAIDWLSETIDESGVWPIVTAAVDEAPHAPWWNWSQNLAESWNSFAYNPSAELLGYLYAWRPVAPEALLAAAETAFRRTLDRSEMIEGAYDLKCAVRLAESPGVPEAVVRPLEALIRRSLAAHDPNDEHLDLLELAPGPGALLAEALADRVGPALDAAIAAQEADGGWPLFWDWGFVDAAAWARAKRDWRGWRTRETLAALDAWGRIEP